jgi:uncharacterized membrane protein
MQARTLTAAAIATGLASLLVSPAPALARNYYAVQNTKTHKCYVLPKKPKSKSVVLVSGSGKYKTRAEARAALKTLSGCST